MNQKKTEMALKSKGGVGKLVTRLGMFLLAFTMSVSLVAQSSKTVEGTVSSEDGEPLIGVSVIQSGTSTGTVTDIDGNFKISVPDDASLVFTYMGFQTQKISVKGKTSINVKLAEDAKLLGEVVVTALGIKREKKALGYAVQEVGGDALLESRQSNVTNALSGKVAGLQVIKSSNGPGGSSKINIRGNNSLTGDNQPLIVVDGIPLDNKAGADNNDFWNPATDMGNGLSSIAPEDIESMSVLKGGSAAALYGSRAGNGVILITTKTGSKRAGLGITISGSVGIETAFMNPKMQKSFGQGLNGVFDSTQSSSWGPAMGTQVTNEDGSSRTLQYYDNTKNYFKTGTNFTENISFTQQYDNTSVYLSLNRLDDNSRIPEVSFNRTNLTARAVSMFGADKRWTLDTKVQYSNTNAKNRPASGINSSNKFYTMYTMPTSVDIRQYKQFEDANGQMLWWDTKGNSINPYWLDKRKLNEDTKDRYNMFASLKYQFTDWLNAEVKAGSDMYYTDESNRTYSGSSLTSTGRYNIGQSRFYENNYSFLAVANKDNLWDKLGGTVSFGGNVMVQRFKKITLGPGELLMPNVFIINNSKNGQIEGTSKDEQQKTNSLYGMLQVNYGGWAFLDVTARNDWSSTLSKKNRSFFYPSVALSWVITDMLERNSVTLPSWIDFGKVRTSWAEVGNSLNPYELYNEYGIGTDPNGLITLTPGDVLFDQNVKPEKIKTFEVGAEAKFLKNRIGIDFAWYKQNATNQLLNIAQDEMTGYKYKKINAGNIQNTGIELMVNGTPIQTATGFTWNVMVNFSKNSNTIKELYPEGGIDTYNLINLDNISIIAREGGKYGEIWGTKYLRVEDKTSEHYGKLLLTEDGRPQMTPEKYKLGDQQPDFMLGLTNSFSYKNFNMSFLIDGRFGGEMYSGTLYNMKASGTLDVTAPGGRRDDFVVDGVVSNGSGGYTVNTSAISQERYWRESLSINNTGIAEENIYDATNIRLRNISLSYDFPRKMLTKTPFQQVRLGFTCNNVWMISSHMKGIDPESVYAVGTNASGFENASSPTNRSYLFNVTLGF